MLGLLMMMLIAGSTEHLDIRSFLAQQGFDGPINGRESISYAGEIEAGRNHYQIYLYHGVFRAAEVDHGVNKLIVMLNGSTFYGSYEASMTKTCAVRGRKVVCDSGVVEFTDRGPPSRILLDGQVEDIAGGLTE